MNKVELNLPWLSGTDTREIFGVNDEYIKIIEEDLRVSIFVRDGLIKISGERDDVEKARKVLVSLKSLISGGQPLEKQSVEYAVSMIRSGADMESEYNETVCYTVRGKRIRSKTHGQQKYIQAVRKNDIVFAIGPAGTGKTYLAIAMAVDAFKKDGCSRIVLVRPAVEAGERLGFLPGDLKDKVDPYLRPLYDALFEIMGIEAYERNVARGAIEVAPLAYMRGRTIDNAFIILDEAQNTTPEQMKMFLTRLGFGSKAVVTGDITQIDLPQGKNSGLITVEKILGNIKNIEFIRLTQTDVVRNSLVQKIINAYENYEESDGNRQ